jgi:hypothetical protein
MILAVGSVAEAKARLDAIERDDSLRPLQAGVLAYLAGDLDGCCAHMLSALERAPRLAWNVIVREASYQFARAVRETGRTSEAAGLLDDLFAANPTMIAISIHDPLDNQDALDLREKRIAEQLPSAAVITQTKSGSVSVGAVLASGFGLPTVTYAMVTEAVVPSWAWDFSRGGACYVTHLRPTADAVAQIEMAGINRVFVHMRDPRQAYLSWLHYAPGLWGARQPADFAERFEHQFSWYLEAVDWIAGWAGASERLGIHFSTFEAFVADRDGFIDRMVAAYGGDPRHFDREAATTRYAGTDYHLRRGETDEWRRALAPAQIARLDAALPPFLADRFGWPLA